MGKDLVDIIFLDNDTPKEVITGNIENLKSPYVEIQISDDFTEIPLYMETYDLLKSINKYVLLTIPSKIKIEDIHIRNVDSVFLTYEKNNGYIESYLRYCENNNIRHCLRVFKNENLQRAKELLNNFPCLTVFIRMENIDFKFAYDLFKDEAIYLDLPLCLSDKYNLTTALKATYDVVSFLDKSGYYLADKKKFIKGVYNKLKEPCKDCSIKNSCFGFLKNSLSVMKTIGSCDNHNIDYIPVTDIICNNKSVDFSIIEFNPEKYMSSGKDAVDAIKQMQKTRLEKKFSGKNFYYIWDIKKSFYFNRPLTEEELFKKDDRGLMSLNWQFIGIDNPNMLWKQKCDLLLPEHGFVITSQVSFDSHWSEEDQKRLDDFTLNSLMKIILNHGGDPAKLRKEGNDLLYDGKKFCGKEWLFRQGYGYIENTVVTCEYLPEKEWFDKLYHHEGEYVITGISEEVKSCTKEVLLKELYEECVKFFRGF